MHQHRLFAASNAVNNTGHLQQHLQRFKLPICNYKSRSKSNCKSSKKNRSKGRSKKQKQTQKQKQTLKQKQKQKTKAEAEAKSKTRSKRQKPKKKCPEKPEKKRNTGSELNTPDTVCSSASPDPGQPDRRRCPLATTVRTTVVKSDLVGAW